MAKTTTSKHAAKHASVVSEEKQDKGPTDSEEDQLLSCLDIDDDCSQNNTPNYAKFLHYQALNVQDAYIIA